MILNQDAGAAWGCQMLCKVPSGLRRQVVEFLLGQGGEGEGENSTLGYSSHYGTALPSRVLPLDLPHPQ